MAEKSEGNGKRRGPGRPFQKGQVANPGGRPKIPEDVKAAFREHTHEALETLVRIINSETSKDADKIRAAEIIMDRAWGKAAQSMELDLNQIPQVVFINADDVPD